MTSGGLQVVHVVLDCADAEAIVPFWEAVLGFRKAWTMGQFTGLEDPAGKRPGFMLQQVPEAKVVKNRMHLDLGTRELYAEAERLESLGGRRLVERREGGAHWIVMADPEGNEFCLTEQRAG